MTKKKKAGLIVGAIVSLLAVFDLTAREPSDSLLRNLQAVVAELLPSEETSSDVAPVESSSVSPVESSDVAPVESTQ